MKKIAAIIAALAIGGAAAMAATTDPQYPGGKEALDKYITENLKYPEAAQKNGIEGVVNVSFMVLPDGTIGSIKIVRLVDPDLEAEAIRLVKEMPAWTPAKTDGKAVESTATVQVIFSLPD